MRRGCRLGCSYWARRLRKERVAKAGAGLSGGDGLAFAEARTGLIIHHRDTEGTEKSSLPPSTPSEMRVKRRSDDESWVSQMGMRLTKNEMMLERTATITAICQVRFLMSVRRLLISPRNSAMATLMLPMSSFVLVTRYKRVHPGLDDGQSFGIDIGLGFSDHAVLLPSIPKSIVCFAFCQHYIFVTYCVSLELAGAGGWRDCDRFFHHRGRVHCPPVEGTEKS